MPSLRLPSVLALLLVGCGATSGDDSSGPSPSAPTSSRPTVTVELPEAVNALAQDDRFLYAATETRTGAERATIHRIDKASARNEPLIEVPGRAAIVPWLAAGEDGIYWSNGGEDQPGLWRANKDGGGALRLVAPEPGWFIVEVTLDGDRLLYIEGTNEGATPASPNARLRTRSVPIRGGAPTDQPAIPGSGFATDEAFVYSCASDGVYRTPRSAGPAQRIGSAPCGALQRDGARLSWLYNSGILGDTGEGDISLLSATDLQVMPLAGGPAPTVARGNIWGLASNGGQQLTLEYLEGPRRLVVRATTEELVTISFAPRDSLPAGAIVADAARVYWSEPREDERGWHGTVRFVTR